MAYQVSDIFLATPTRGQLNWNHVKAIYRLMADHPDLLQPELESGGLGVCHPRNMLVQKFLSTPAKILFFIDDDVVPRPTVMKMLAHLDQYDIVGAPYPLVHPPLVPIPTPCAFKEVRKAGYVPLDDIFMLRGIQECEALGTGCMMIKREVLEHEGIMPFKLGVDDKGIMKVSEDILFCMKAKEAGFRIGADFDQVADHCHILSLNTTHHAYMNKLMKAIEIDRADQANQSRIVLA
jgi:hypothetical protein